MKLNVNFNDLYKEHHKRGRREWFGLIGIGKFLARTKAIKYENK